MSHFLTALLTPRVVSTLLREPGTEVAGSEDVPACLSLGSPVCPTAAEPPRLPSGLHRVPEEVGRPSHVRSGQCRGF